MNQNILQDSKANEKLIKEGYAIVPFANLSEIDSLIQFYNINSFPNPSPFHTTHFSIDVEYKTKIHHHLVTYLSKNLQNTFIEFQPIFANFMVKEGGGNNPMPLHADWTYVEEDQLQSFAVWIPLVDVTLANGTIGVIPYSHDFSNKIRGPRIMQWEPPIGERIINEFGKLIPMKKGNALIYNHRTLHYSLPNYSKTVRPAINISMVPLQSKLLHYSIPEGQQELLRFNVEDSFFYLDYENFKFPKKGVLVDRMANNIPLLNDNFESFYKKHKSSQKNSLIDMFKKFMNFKMGN